MAASSPTAGLQLPESLAAQLQAFRRRVWTIKSIEAAGGAIFGLLVSYLCVFALDRLMDTPSWARLAIISIAIGGCACALVSLHRWIWRQRRFEQLARLVSRRYPSIGDQMLGIIELARNEFEQSRSRSLCQAAIEQVAVAAGRRDFSDAVPNPRHRFWAWMAAVPMLTAVAVLALFPAAAANAWSRFVMPWRPIPRFTFTSVEQLPERIVVPHGEPVAITVRLAEDSRWRPAQGVGQLGGQAPLTAELKRDRYDFSLPGQIGKDWFQVNVGDARQRVLVEPMPRPELSAAIVDIQLPAYLGRERPLHKDLRGGAITMVNGSLATFAVTANRALASGLVDGQPRPLATATLTSLPITVSASRGVTFAWRDEFGLEGREPFKVAITARDDEAPTISCEDLPRRKVVLDSEILHFSARSRDDYGVKRIGLEWKSLATQAENPQAADPQAATPDEAKAEAKSAHGERLLAAGGCYQEQVEAAGVFSGQTLGVKPQTIEVRLFAEDFFPGRARVYSAPHVLHVLGAEQHFIWLTEQLSKWHRQSLEVRDREMQLRQTNQQLRLLAPDAIDQPATRRRIEAQAAAEQANGRRLSGLVNGGEELVRQAMRNPEFGVGHLEQLAEMLQILKDISNNRMPNVADLLKQAARAKEAAASSAAKSPPAAGQARNSTPASPAKSSEPKPPAPPVPKLVDAESSQQPTPKGDDQPKEPGKNSSPGKFGLPTTTVAGSVPKPKDPPPEDTPPAGQKLDEALKAQQDLLAEFDRIADEFNAVLANLEGSTLVKRLKAASRQQYVIAGQIADQLSSQFGQPFASSAPRRQAMDEIASVEAKGSQNISNIMDDMQAYFDRRRLQRFKTVLDEMRQEDAIGSLRQLSDELPREVGMSMAQCEFWSDAFDRWADDLVDPAKSGKCPGGKSKSSLPPSVVLEALRILEGEVNLREETRGAEQARPALGDEGHQQLAAGLRDAQAGLADRTGALTQRIREAPDGEGEFAGEIVLLGFVQKVMNEAAHILARPETGAPAIAAETEAIELLLQSKKINPNGGGGGGASPGGGGGGTTRDSALALIGAGLNEKEVREDRGVSQATGAAGSSLPEEFRAGLDEYFNRLEQDRNPP